MDLASRTLTSDYVDAATRQAQAALTRRGLAGLVLGCAASWSGQILEYGDAKISWTFQF